jgi:hypothetical protein
MKDGLIVWVSKLQNTHYMPPYKVCLFNDLEWYLFLTMAILTTYIAHMVIHSCWMIRRLKGWSNDTLGLHHLFENQGKPAHGLGQYLTQACELKLFLFHYWCVLYIVKHKNCFVLKSSTTRSKLLWLVLGLCILIKWFLMWC